MRNRNLLPMSTGIALALFLTTQVFAQALIEGLIWKDTAGNVVVLTKMFPQVYHREIDYYLLEDCTITYFDGKLRGVWEEKQRRLGKMGLGSF